MESDNREALKKRVWALWLGWTLSTGTITLVILLSLAISEMWLPFVALGLSFIFYLLQLDNDRRSSCYLIPYVCSRILFISAVVMVFINLMYLGVIPWNVYTAGTINPDIPFIVSLITAPVSLGVLVWALIRGRRIDFCRRCSMRRMIETTQTDINKIFLKESAYQLRLLFLMTALHTVMSTVYYFFFYINVNINTPDRFFFVWVPVIFWALSVIYLGSRYISISLYHFGAKGKIGIHSDGTILLRYMILSDNHLLMRECNDVQSPMPQYDTPAFLKIPYREEVSLAYSSGLLSQVIKPGHHTLKFLYRQSGDMGDDEYHYACFLQDKHDIVTSELNGEWFSMEQIEQMINARRVSPMLASEIVRIYTITMAWKAYDKDGKRLFKVKNYRPTFRFDDIEKANVDYGDATWLHVAANNEDKPFFHLRRFLRRVWEA